MDKPRMPSKDRTKVATECFRGHPLSGTNIRINKYGSKQCLTCARMWYEANKPEPKPRAPRRVSDPAERFLRSYEVTSNGCWQWQKVIRNPSKGYGQMFVDRKRIQAHRYAYELLVGPIPERLTIDHLCMNTGCVNPAHMEPVTAEENSRRRRAEHRALTARQ